MALSKEGPSKIFCLGLFNSYTSAITKKKEKEFVILKLDFKKAWWSTM
jgi:hypothetical protein